MRVIRIALLCALLSLPTLTIASEVRQADLDRATALEKATTDDVRQACESDHESLACAELGKRQMHGDRVEKNLTAAKRNLQIGCAGQDSNAGWACFDLGTLYRGFGMKLAGKARKFLAQACDEGIGESCRSLGDFSQSDKATQDTWRLVKLRYKQGCHADPFTDLESCNQLARLLQKRMPFSHLHPVKAFNDHQPTAEQIEESRETLMFACNEDQLTQANMDRSCKALATYHCLNDADNVDEEACHRAAKMVQTLCEKDIEAADSCATGVELHASAVPFEGRSPRVALQYAQHLCNTGKVDKQRCQRLLLAALIGAENDGIPMDDNAKQFLASAREQTAKACEHSDSSDGAIGCALHVDLAPYHEKLLWQLRACTDALGKRSDLLLSLVRSACTETGVLPDLSRDTYQHRLNKVTHPAVRDRISALKDQLTTECLHNPDMKPVLAPCLVAGLMTPQEQSAVLDDIQATTCVRAGMDLHGHLGGEQLGLHKLAARSCERVAKREETQFHASSGPRERYKHWERASNYYKRVCEDADRIFDPGDCKPLQSFKTANPEPDNPAARL